jgi:hypothetical protein
MKRIVAVLAVATGVAVGVWSVITHDDYKCERVRYLVNEGDTLWSIASRYCDGNIQSATDDLVETYGTSLRKWQVIEVGQ